MRELGPLSRFASVNPSSRVALVTGAAGGIGRAIATRLAGEGWTLALADRDRAGLEDLVAGLRERGHAPSLHVVDFVERDSAERLRDSVLAAHDGVRLLVNNAGLTVFGALESQSAADVEKVLAVNLVAVAQMCRVFAPVLVASAPANIVNIASFAGMLAFPLQSTYSASKFGVRGLSQALRIELSDRRVTVSAVLPGSVATRLMQGATSYDADMQSTFIEMMLRYGASPDAVAKAVSACVRRGLPEKLVGWDAHAGVRASRWVPGLVRTGFRAWWASYRRGLRG